MRCKVIVLGVVIQGFWFVNLGFVLRVDNSCNDIWSYVAYTDFFC